MAAVFVSHRSCDASAAIRLAEAIRGAGHSVWIDEWNLTIGSSVIGGMNAGLTAADYVVVCYSEQGIESPWMAREWMSTLARQLEGHPVKILPAVLSGSGAAILADLKHADLAGNWDRGIRDLLAAMG